MGNSSMNKILAKKPGDLSLDDPPPPPSHLIPLLGEMETAGLAYLGASPLSVRDR